MNIGSPGPTRAPAIPLANALVGQELTFVGVTHGGAGLTHRLAELGLIPGMRLEVVNRGPGPFIVCVRGCRMVLGRGMVDRVLVRPTLPAGGGDQAGQG